MGTMLCIVARPVLRYHTLQNQTRKNKTIGLWKLECHKMLFILKEVEAAGMERRCLTAPQVCYSTRERSQFPPAARSLLLKQTRQSLHEASPRLRPSLRLRRAPGLRVRWRFPC